MQLVVDTNKQTKHRIHPRVKGLLLFLRQIKDMNKEIEIKPENKKT